MAGLWFQVSVVIDLIVVMVLILLIVVIFVVFVIVVENCPESVGARSRVLGACPLRAAP